MRANPSCPPGGKPGAPRDVGTADGGQPPGGLPRAAPSADGQGGARDAEREAEEKEEAWQGQKESGSDAEQGRW